MGWTGINTRKSFDEVFQDEFQSWILNQTIKRYVEVKVKPPFEECVCEESEFFIARYYENAIVCDVIIFSRRSDRVEVMYKIMSDTEGPRTINKCPKKILDILSPVEKYSFIGYADIWRKRQSLN